MLYAILCLFVCCNFLINSQRYKEKNTFQLIIGDNTENAMEMCPFSSFHKCSISNACSYVIRFKNMSECKEFQNLKQLEISADMLVWEKLPKRPGTYRCFSTLVNYFTVRKGSSLNNSFNKMSFSTFYRVSLKVHRFQWLLHRKRYRIFFHRSSQNWTH